MTEPILDPSYWEQRLRTAAELHHSVFRCPLDRWLRIEAKHREILAKLIKPDAALLDAGCGYGRLLTLLPTDWRGPYLGVDLSPALIAKARELHPRRALNHFVVGDLRNLRLTSVVPAGDYLGMYRWDYAVLISVRPMVRRNCGDEIWAAMEREIRRVAKKLLFLKYDEAGEGSVE